MRKITQEEIIEITCREYGITSELLLTRSRRDPLPTVRAIIAHLLYRELGMFPRDILPLTGHPADHRTAVYYYLGRRTLVESRLPFNKELSNKFQNIRMAMDVLCSSTGRGIEGLSCLAPEQAERGDDREHTV